MNSKTTREEFEALLKRWAELGYSLHRSVHPTDGYEICGATKHCLPADATALAAEVEHLAQKHSEIHYSRGRVFNGRVSFSLYVATPVSQQDIDIAAATANADAARY